MDYQSNQNIMKKGPAMRLHVLWPVPGHSCKDHALATYATLHCFTASLARP